MNYLLIAFLSVLLINLVGFLFAYKWQTDKLTDITYSLCFFALAIGIWLWKAEFSFINSLLMLMVAAWSIRLGAYLFLRIHKIGVDHRFDQMRPKWNRYIRFWILQALSIMIIALPFIIGLHDMNAISFSELTILQLAGMFIWFAGWLIQSIADWQKYNFKQNPENTGMFMHTGLYRQLRHPNYLGEIMVWVGIFCFCIPYLDGWEWLSIISPIWIITLLVFISGIPLLEKSNYKKYGQLEEYQKYFKSTWRLVWGIY